MRRDGYTCGIIAVTFQGEIAVFLGSPEARRNYGLLNKIARGEINSQLIEHRIVKGKPTSHPNPEYVYDFLFFLFSFFLFV